MGSTDARLVSMLVLYIYIYIITLGGTEKNKRWPGFTKKKYKIVKNPRLRLPGKIRLSFRFSMK